MKPFTNIKIINHAIGIVLFLWLSYILYNQLQTQPNLPGVIVMLKSNWTPQRIMLVVLVFVLMLANWSLEAVKWQLLIRDVQQISFKRSLRSVFTGISISLLTPNRIGEYAGRIIYLKNIHKLKGVVANIVGSFAQFIAACIFGCIGMLCYYFLLKNTYILQNNMWYFLPVIIGSLVLMGLLFYVYFNITKITTRLQRFAFLRKFTLILNIVHHYNNNILWRLVSLSALRYFIFAFQFYILLQIFAVSVGFAVAMCCIFSIFWLMAIVPSIAIAEIGIRAQISVLIFGAFTTNVLGVISTSVLLWLINLIIPALVGALLMLGTKLIGNK